MVKRVQDMLYSEWLNVCSETDFPESTLVCDTFKLMTKLFNTTHGPGTWEANPYVTLTEWRLNK